MQSIKCLNLLKKQKEPFNANYHESERHLQRLYYIIWTLAYYETNCSIIHKHNAVRGNIILHTFFIESYFRDGKIYFLNKSIY